MKPLIILLLFLTIACSASAQSRQQQKVDSVFIQVKKYFNLKNTDALYNLAGSAFQKSLSIDAFGNAVNQQLFPLGSIEESSLISFLNNSIATYKLKIGSVNMQVLLSLDKMDKIELFLFQPFKDPIGNKTALVASSNLLKTETDKKVDTVARKYIQKGNTVGICVAVIKDGKTFTYGYGEIKKGSDKLPNPDNFFEIGSITKTFTSTLLAYYVNEGKIKLTDPITKYLPDSVSANPELKGITLLNLSNHTSGFISVPGNLVKYASDPFNPYKDYTKQLLYSYLKTCKPDSRPGERYAYSNLAVGLLGTILERISGKPFTQMVTEIICKPLGMFSTDQYLNPLLSPRFVSVYNADGKPTPAWDFDVLAPCGALRSTLNDLIIYTKTNMHPRTDALSKAIELTHEVTFNKDVKIGMAWHVITVNSVDYYFHNGGTYGSSSFLAFNPQKNLAVIILSNAAESTDVVGVEILKKLQR